MVEAGCILIRLYSQKLRIITRPRQVALKTPQRADAVREKL